MVGSTLPVRTVQRCARRTIDESDVAGLKSMSGGSALRVSIVTGSQHGSMTRGRAMKLSTEHAEWFAQERGIPQEIAEQAEVSTSNGNIAFDYATFRKIRGPGKQFWIEPVGAELCLWNEKCLSEAVDLNEPLIITEGEIDALSFMTAGASNVVSVPNGSPYDKPGKGNIDPLDDNAFKYLWDGSDLKGGLKIPRKIIVAADDDHKGRVLRDELAIRLGRDRCYFVTYPAGCKDCNEVLLKHGVDGVNDLISGAKPVVSNKLANFSEIPKPVGVTRYHTGWTKLDNHLVICPPELVIVTGVPGSGKSQWTLALVSNLARVHKLNGAILQFEDNVERNRRDLLRYAQGWRTAGKNTIDIEPVEWLDKMFCTIAPSEKLGDDDEINLEWLESSIREAVCRHGAKWVLIDPWNEIEHVWGVSETETTYTNKALRHLKRLARHYQIAIIVVAHPSKTGGTQKGIKQMTLYDVSGSAAWKNKADHGIIIHRDNPGDLVTQVKIDKSKDFMIMGRPGTLEMEFIPSKATFRVV